MSACGPHDSGVDSATTARGSAPPFLPTLATALAVGLLSLVCRGPSAPVSPVVTAQTSPAGADGFHPVPAATEPAPVIPAALAFARLHPLTLQIPHLADADETARAPAPRTTRSAAATRRSCTTPRCGETRRADTAVRAAPPPIKSASEPAAIPMPMRGQAEADEGLLPAGVLPFAATAASWVESARKLGQGVGSDAASLGGTVVALIACAR